MAEAVPAGACFQHDGRASLPAGGNSVGLRERPTGLANGGEHVVHGRSAGCLDGIVRDRDSDWSR